MVNDQAEVIIIGPNNSTCIAHHNFIIIWMYLPVMGQDSIVGTVTCYRLDGPMMVPWWGRDFLHPSGHALGPTQPPVQWTLRFFAAGLAARTWC